MTEYRKKLIEVALPLEAINIASAREKSIRHGHPSTLHLWWSRKPLAAARAVLFASLIDDPNGPDAPTELVEACRALPRGKNASDHDTPRQRLFDFIETLVQWESTTDEQVLGTARHLIQLATGGNPPPLLDPFAGGGSIPLEAQRLGLEAYASDLNPVAVMINKALIEIPPMFADRPPVNPRDREKLGSSTGWKGAAGLAADVRYYGERMREKAWEKIGHLYPSGPKGETIIAWLWVRAVKCPNPACGALMPLANSFWLSRKKTHSAWVEPVVDTKNKSIRFKLCNGQPSEEQANIIDAGSTAIAHSGKKPKATFRCACCGIGIAKGDYIDQEANHDRMTSMPLAIVAEGSRGRTYLPFDDIQWKKAITEAAEYLDATKSIRDNLPLEPAKGTFGSNAQGRIYGFKQFADYFSSRQLVTLTTLSGLVADVCELVRADAGTVGLPSDDLGAEEIESASLEYANAIALYLAFGVDRLADRLSTLASWDASRDSMRNTFALQAIAIAWNYAEGNPFSDSTGNFQQCIEWIAEVLERLAPAAIGHAFQEDAMRLKHDSAALISTDPPYYHNVSYAVLTDYFYVWLRRCLKTIYPDIFGTLLTPKDTELVVTPHKFDGDKVIAKEYFEEGLYQAFDKMRLVTNANYPMTVFYAFMQSETKTEENGKAVSSTGWETMLEGLIKAGLLISGTWPIRTELANRTSASDANALASSIVLVCQPRLVDAHIVSRADFVKYLRAELPSALKELQDSNIAPVDLAQASIGPGMAVYSRYSQVLEPNGQRLSVRTALQIINQVLDEYLAEQEGDLDADSRFAVAWFEQYGFREAEFGVADVLARAKNTSVEGLAHAGVLKSGAGKVQLIAWSDLDPGWDPATDKRVTTWEATHHLIEQLNNHGESGAAMLLAKMPAELAASARGLAYRLYSICERKGWADIARDYNALVISWGASQEQAVQLREQYQQGTLF